MTQKTFKNRLKCREKALDVEASVLIRSFMGSGGASELVKAKKRFLSQASAALDTSSRRKTS